MKRDCKKIDLIDAQTIAPWVYQCIDRHKRRHDFRDMLCMIGGLSRKEYYEALETHNCGPFLRASEKISQEAAHRIAERKLNLRPVSMEERKDRSSGKIRLIGRESAMQQIFDSIADGAAQDIWKRRLVPQQASSIPGRGQIYGKQMIRKWVQKDNQAARWAKKHRRKYSRKCKYFVKLDIRKCYQSMRLEIFLEKFRRDCANETLIWLWTELLRSHRAGGYEGFMIGALPSQSACQYLISFLYRFAMNLHGERRGKKTKLVSHCLMYMDDILLIGASRKDLKKAVQKLIVYAKTFGLTIKPNWHIRALQKTPIDMMGYVIHSSGKVTIRPRIFLRIRRLSLRCKESMSRKQAQRAMSFKGYLKNSDSGRIQKRLSKLYYKAGGILRNECTVQFKTGASPIHAPA